MTVSSIFSVVFIWKTIPVGWPYVKPALAVSEERGDHAGRTRQQPFAASGWVHLRPENRGEVTIRRAEHGAILERDCRGGSC
jgi:hypothetical protein